MIFAGGVPLKQGGIVVGAIGVSGGMGGAGPSRRRDGRGAFSGRCRSRTAPFDQNIEMQKITPFLWFDGKAEEAAQLYTSVFPDSRIDHISRFGEEGPGPAGSAMVVEFTLLGQGFRGLNAGPQYKFTPAVSFQVDCETQEEIDRYWNTLLEGGEAMACGWLTDRFGLCWQITPSILGRLLSDPDPARSGRAMKAMMDMVKLDIAALERAANGETA